MKNDFNLQNRENPTTPGKDKFFLYDPKGDDFCLDYAESLAEGDLRPIILEDYKKDDEDELF